MRRIIAVVAIVALSASNFAPSYVRPTRARIPRMASQSNSLTGSLAGTGQVQNYPRIANLYAYGAKTQASAFARFGLVISNPLAGPDGAIKALKSQSPSTKVVDYYNAFASYIPGFIGLTIYPGWWLTLAGTTLSVPLTDTSSTTIHVVNAKVIANYLSTNRDVLVDGESMHVFSADTNANTLTVQRGYNSTASTHSAGARIAAHAVSYSAAKWMLNITSYCPTDPSTGLTWSQYLVRTVVADMAAYPWDGVFFDNAGSSVTALDSGQIDANNDNVGDGGNGPSGNAWSAGMAALFAATRAALPNALIIGNGESYSTGGGQELENFEDWWPSWLSGVNTYLQLAGPSGLAHVTIVNPDTSGSTAQNLQTMRANLAVALMGNGYYAYDGGATSHGETWWYDEYDGGQGSSLSIGIDSSQTTLQLAAGTGARFSVGDVLNVPDDPATSIWQSDEQMLVVGKSGDTLLVQRGYNGTDVWSHAVLSKVMTQAQITAGQGWLGQPLGAASSLSTNLWRRDFTNGIVLLNGTSSPQTVTVGSGFKRIAGTQDPSVDDGAVVSAVTIPAQDGIILQRSS